MTAESDLRVAFLTNLIPPYHKPLYSLLANRYSAFRFFVSTPMEPNRPWLPDWSGLDVVTQKGIALRRRWRHTLGFEEPTSVHFPLDTLSQLAAFKPDVIISVEMGFRTLLALAYTTFHPKCRLLIWSEVTAHTEQGRGTTRSILRRFVAKRAHGFLALGKEGVTYIKSLGVPVERIFKITYSSNLPAFTEIPVERHGPTAHRLLYSGQLIARKGLLPFLKALAIWAADHPDRSIEFTLVGSGPEHSNLAALPLPPNLKLTFVGSLQYAQLPAIYVQSGIFVLPTLADTWAVVVNEALASGLPVLGSLASQAVAEMVTNGETGWTFNPDKPAEMHAALHQALTTTEAQLNLMRPNSRHAALQVTPDQTAETIHHAIIATEID